MRKLIRNVIFFICKVITSNYIYINILPDIFSHNLILSITFRMVSNSALVLPLSLVNCRGQNVLKLNKDN